MTQKYQHCIFVCSNYTNGTRTGLHFLYNETNIFDVMEIAKRYTQKEGVAFYFVVTDEPTIESVKKKDKFFKSIEIYEGSDSANIILFNNSINNQITVMDVALLLISRQKMSIKHLKTCLFYVYCLFAKKYNLFPFKEKCSFEPRMIGFKTINSEFERKDENKIVECINPDIIMSKFFNCSGGVELMNKILELFYDITSCDINYLTEKMNTYYDKCVHKYKLNKEQERRYIFRLSKKTINALNINLN